MRVVLTVVEWESKLEISLVELWVYELVEWTVASMVGWSAMMRVVKTVDLMVRHLVDRMAYPRALSSER